MSNVKGQLDLSGINVQKFVQTRKPRITQKQKFEIQVAEGEASGSIFSIKCIFAVFTVLLLLVTAMSIASSSSSTNTYTQTNNFKHLTPGLRKIIRMKCSHDSSTHCTTSHMNGEYVVNIPDSCDVYEFNGIPFTDVFRDNQKNFHVPPSSSLTLVVNKACKLLTATYDTSIKYNKQYPVKNNNKEGRIQKIVWIPSQDCYTEYTLLINNEKILENTPRSMIEKKVLNKVTAYTYITHGSVSGAIKVEGTGCEVPINIYSLVS